MSFEAKTAVFHVLLSESFMKIRVCSLPQVITVGATDFDDERWPSSNWGPCVDVFAPGVNIKSATFTGPSDTDELSGTSEACPHVTGKVIVWKIGRVRNWAVLFILK